MKVWTKKLRKRSILIIFLFFSAATLAVSPFSENFESGDLSPDLWQRDMSDNCEIQFISDPTRTGKLALQFTASKKARCELVPHTVRGRFGALKRKILREPYHQDRWYAFSTFLRAPWQRHKSNEVLAQWHASPDPIIANEHGRGPPLALRVVDGYFRISYGWDKAFRSTEKHIAKYTLWYAPLKAGEWIDWLFQVKWSYEDDGLVKIWKNGELIVDYRGPNAYNDLRGVYLKLGVYHPRPERSVVFDDIYIDDIAPDFAPATAITGQ